MSRASRQSTVTVLLPTMTAPMVPVNAMVQTVMVMTVPVMQVVMMPMVPKMDTGSPMHTMNLGASLRDRAFRCNLRFAPISAAIPRASAPFGRCALRLPGGSLRSPPLPDRHARAEVRRLCAGDRRGLLATALRATLVAVLASLALAGCAGCGHRLGSARRHAVRRRCRLRRPPTRPPPGASPAPLVRALLRSERAPRSAPRRAVVSAPVRTPPPALPPSCRARPRAASAARPAAQSPHRLR